MYRKHLGRNTLIAMLCCLFIVGSIGVSHSFVKDAWDWITGAKDVVEGVQSILDALRTDLQEAENRLAAVNDRKKGHVDARNKVKAKILPDEQEQSQAERDGNAAAIKHNNAMSEASTLRSEIDALTEELRYILRYGSTSDPRHDEILADLTMKNGALSVAEDTMSEAKKAYNKAKSRVKYIKNKLRGDRRYISYLTGLIAACDREIEDLEQKIEDINQAIKDEKERRIQVPIDTAEGEAEFEEMEEKAKQPPE
ncbi:MAG: hypothetical protein OXI67_20705 [Candidatus Poribacteria bacterium]|nr:hypothetical protein [Candidatus Poribacteria bacterium]